MNTLIRTQGARLGIDFGGVIIPMGHRNPYQDTQCGQRFLLKPHPNTLHRIKELVEAFQGKVWIVSHCGEQTEQLILRWLEQHRFFAFTRMRRDHVRFCRERPQKAPICAELGITHFIDDRIKVMELLRKTVPNLYLFGEKEQNRCARTWTVLVADWEEAYTAVIKDLNRAAG